MWALGREHSPTPVQHWPPDLSSDFFCNQKRSVFDNRIKHRYTPQLKIVSEGEEIPSSNQFRFHFTDLLQAKGRDKKPQGIISLRGWKTNTLFRNGSQVNSFVYLCFELCIF